MGCSCFCFFFLCVFVFRTLPIARDLGRWGMRICTICPGIFATPMTNIMPKPMKQSLEGNITFPKRFGRSEEFASLVQQITENTYLNVRSITVLGVFFWSLGVFFSKGF